MRFARFAEGRTGLVIGSRDLQVLDVVSSLPILRDIDRHAADAISSVLHEGGWQSWVGLIDRWDDVRGAFGTLVALAESERGIGLPMRRFDETPLQAPLASPQSHIFSMSSNTVIHIQHAFRVMLGVELTPEQVLQAKSDDLPPGGFTIWPDSVVGPGGIVAPPDGFKLFDYEAECAVYVRKGGRNLQTVELWGYAAWNDLGVRDANLGLIKDSKWGPFSLNLMKNFDTGNACGPWVVVDEPFDINGLRCTLHVNGELRQDWNLADMIYSFDEMLTFISTYATLRPGDILTSGTGAGTAIELGLDGAYWLKPGDVVEVGLEGAGILRNIVGDWSHI